MKNNQRLKAIDFFCSGGGMSYGLVQAGIDVIAGIDVDLKCKETYEANIPSSKFISADITKLKAEQLQDEVDIQKNDDNMIFIGCSPCQYWTIINTDKSKSTESKNLLNDFYRFINYFNPGYIVIENVPGIIKRYKESGLDKFIYDLKGKGYKIWYDVLNLNHFGVPQSRKRFTLIATRVNKIIIYLKPDKKNLPVVRDFIGEHNGFPKIPAGYRDNTEFMHTTAKLSHENLERIRRTPKNGGTRLVWADTELQLETYKKHGSNSFRDVYGRMSWDKPAPTITTKFYSLSNGRFGHPEEDRALSLREGATLQTFPKAFVFKTKSMIQTAKIIGNAVPPKFAKRIGETIIKASENGK